MVMEKGEQSAVAGDDMERGGVPRCPGACDESDEGSLCFSDAEDRSWHSRHDSNCAGSALEDYISPCSSVRDSAAAAAAAAEGEERSRKSCVSECSLDDIDLEVGLAEIKASPEKAERNCRICHLGIESAAPESGVGITLGCSCKDDLSCAHKQCAETWFKIRGNKTCEICGSTACNVVGSGDSEFMEQWNETNNTTAMPAPPSETRRFWQGHRFLNFLLACMVFAFVISWLFHFNVPG